MVRMVWEGEGNDHDFLMSGVFAQLIEEVRVSNAERTLLFAMSRLS